MRLDMEKTFPDRSPAFRFLPHRLIGPSAHMAPPMRLLEYFFLPSQKKKRRPARATEFPLAWIFREESGPVDHHTCKATRARRVGEILPPVCGAAATTSAAPVMIPSVINHKPKLSQNDPPSFAWVRATTCW